MTELEKIAYTKSFIDDLANGINPLDGTHIPDDELINHVRLSRCFFYVSDILRRVIENGGIARAPIPKKSKRKAEFALTREQIEAFAYSEVPIPITEVHNRIAALGVQEGMKRMPYQRLTRWLLLHDLIEQDVMNGEKIKRPTALGEEIGISLQRREGPYGSYYVTLYNKDAQHFILDNIESVLALDQDAYRKKMNLENQGKAWQMHEDEQLVSLYQSGASIKEIAEELRRGERAIFIRLRSKGINLDEIPVSEDISALDT